MMRVPAMLVAASLIGCGGNAPTQEPDLNVVKLPSTITLRVGEQQTIGNAVVRFDAVKNDSRCPSDVTCVWSGNAELQVTVGPKSGSGSILTLNTDVQPKSGAAHGLSLSVVSLSPTPISSKPTRDYQLSLLVDAAR